MFLRLKRGVREGRVEGTRKGAKRGSRGEAYMVYTGDTKCT